MRKQQTDLFEYFKDDESKKRYKRTKHGGMENKGFRKLERPLDTRAWIHLVLKSDKAVGKLSLLTMKNKIFVRKTLFGKAKRFGIKIDDYVNGGNHLHLKIKIQSRENFQKFLKSVTTLIARTITGARRGKKFGRFWQGLAFTRVLKTRLEEINLRGYFIANVFEVENSYQSRERFLKVFNKWVYQDRMGRGGATPVTPMAPSG